MRTIEYHDTTLRVRYAETDQMGVVYHSNYLIWFEVGRVELIRAIGFDYKTMETDDDCHIVVAEAHCRYEKPARYDQVLRVRTRITEWRNRIVKFSYEIFLDENSVPARHRLHHARRLRQQRPPQIASAEISRRTEFT